MPRDASNWSKWLGKIWQSSDYALAFHGCLTQNLQLRRLIEQQRDSVERDTILNNRRDSGHQLVPFGELP
jgi:hypothetical protein